MNKEIEEFANELHKFVIDKCDLVSHADKRFKVMSKLRCETIAGCLLDIGYHKSTRPAVGKETSKENALKEAHKHNIRAIIYSGGEVPDMADKIQEIYSEFYVGKETPSEKLALDEALLKSVIIESVKDMNYHNAKYSLYLSNNEVGIIAKAICGVFARPTISEEEISKAIPFYYYDLGREELAKAIADRLNPKETK